MRVIVDSFEYKCWHEMGHAIICLCLGGDIESIEFLDGHSRGHARTRCDVPPEFERIVACGGFAAEVLLLQKGHAAKSYDDDRDINQIVFHNATADREDFWERRLGVDEIFSEDEDKAFMNHALEFVAPILNQYYSVMEEAVRELANERRIDGFRIKELLRISTIR